MPRCETKTITITKTLPITIGHDEIERYIGVLYDAPSLISLILTITMRVKTLGEPERIADIDPDHARLAAEKLRWLADQFEKDSKL